MCDLIGAIAQGRAIQCLAVDSHTRERLSLLICHTDWKFKLDSYLDSNKESINEGVHEEAPECITEDN
jgi:hypothetical protein